MNYSYMLYCDKIKKIDKEINLLNEKIAKYKKYIDELEEEKKRITNDFLTSNNNMVADIDISHLLDEK